MQFPLLKLTPLLIAIASCLAFAWASPVYGQRIQFPASNTSGLRPITGSTGVSRVANAQVNGGLISGAPVMVPLNPATQSGIFPGPANSPLFDPYSTRQITTPNLPTAPVFNNPVLPQGGYSGAIGGIPGNGMAGSGFPATGYPGYNGAAPALPGAGQSGVIGTYPYTGATAYPPSAFPNSAPSALFPGAYPQTGYGYQSGNPMGNWFGNLFGQQSYVPPGSIAPPGNLVLPPGTSWGNWNPQGAMVNGGFGYPQALRLFQGPRIRHTWIYGSDDPNALQINDTDLALAFAIPNFLYSTQPLYLLPSFSLHQWEGPTNGTADLPAIAYSAFLDSGWQSDPTRIFGAELGLRIGMFTDFETSTSDSLRIMGRGIGRLRLTPATTLKAGVIYLDRNKVKLLPAGGILWQPNPETRFDLFFPEPKLAHYLSTLGTLDTWWYLGGYYGGGAWTVKRDSGAKESIDINDLRLVLGIEWGRNEQIREGRRVGFLEVGYVFQRELLYKESPADNVDLQDSILVRAGIGY